MSLLHTRSHSGLITRSFESADLEIRSDGRTVYGLFAPFDSPAKIREMDPKTRTVVEYDEVFRPGSFARTINSRRNIPGYAEHGHREGRSPIGPVRNLREESVGLVGEMYISDTVQGNETLALVRDGAYGAFSIGFSPVKDLWTKIRDAVARTEVKLFEVSIVAQPAYEGAAIAGVRTDLIVPTPDTLPNLGDPLGLGDETPDPQTHSGSPWRARYARLYDLEIRHG